MDEMQRHAARQQSFDSNIDGRIEHERRNDR
jgi:hypothetical protein